jgi:hypothetical protein
VDAFRNPALPRLQSTAEGIERLAQTTAESELALHKGFDPLVDKLLEHQLTQVEEYGEEPASKWELLAMQTQVRMAAIAQSQSIQLQIRFGVGFVIGLFVGGFSMLFLVSLLNLRVSSGYDAAITRQPSPSIDAENRPGRSQESRP